MNIHYSDRVTLLIILRDNINASVNPIERMTINKNNTYLGAFDVIEKILFGSKYLNIYEIIFIMKKLPDQECQREIITKGK